MASAGARGAARSAKPARCTAGWSVAGQPEPTIQSAARGRCAGLQDEIRCADDARRFTRDTRPRSGARDARLSGEVTAQGRAAALRCRRTLDRCRPRSAVQQGRSSTTEALKRGRRRAMISHNREGDEQHQSTGA